MIGRTPGASGRAAVQVRVSRAGYFSRKRGNKKSRRCVHCASELFAVERPSPRSNQYGTKKRRSLFSLLPLPPPRRPPLLGRASPAIWIAKGRFWRQKIGRRPPLRAPPFTFRWGLLGSRPPLPLPLPSPCCLGVVGSASCAWVRPRRPPRPPSIHPRRCPVLGIPKDNMPVPPTKASYTSICGPTD
jgi:hypothetical protein